MLRKNVGFVFFEIKMLSSAFRPLMRSGSLIRPLIFNAILIHSTEKPQRVINEISRR